MIKYLALTLLLCTFSVNAEPPNKPPKIDFDELVSQLNLEQEQATQLKETMEKHRKSREQHQESRRSVHEANKKEISAILSDKQMEVFHEYMKEHRPKHKKRPKG